MFLQFCSALATALVLFAASPLTLASTVPATCNGYADLCSRNYSSVLQATTHNAYSVGTVISANQHNSIATQLSDGVRALQLDFHRANDSTNTTDHMPELCHTECLLLDAGPLVNTLLVIREFVLGTSSDIVTIFVENDGNFTAAEIAAAFSAAQRLDTFAYAHTNASAPWPTLGDLISSGKYIVLFVDQITVDPAYPWIHSQYSHVWETPFDIEIAAVASGNSSTVTEVDNIQWQCNVDRPHTTTPPIMYLVNHFVARQLSIGGAPTGIAVPGPDISAAANTAALLDKHLSMCQSARSGVMANFITVDFYDLGDALPVVAQANGLVWNGRVTRFIAPPSGGMRLSSAFLGVGVSVALALFFGRIA